MWKVVSCIIAVGVIAGEIQAKELAWPEGTKVNASFRTEKDKSPKALIDGDTSTWMMGTGGSCKTPTDVTSVFFSFPSAIENLGGVKTGKSDQYGNYYPKVMEFYVDSNNDGRFDTKVGSTTALGPADKAQGNHAFSGRLAKAYGLEVRVTHQHVAGGKRAWTMNELGLIQNDSLPLIKATPNGHRVTYFRSPMPKATATANFGTDKGKGIELVLDGNLETAYAAKQGTARQGKASSIYIRFDKPQTDLAGVVLGRSDKYGNYVWQTMELWVDTTGDKRYDTKAGVATGGKGGEKKFDAPVSKAYGVELRVTKQSIKGTRRAFVLAEVPELIFKDGLAESEMRSVVDDFEEFTSWRSWAQNTGQPAGERYFGGYVFITGKKDPAAAKEGQGVGIMRYNFDSTKQGPFKMWSTKGDVFAHKGVIDAITFWANPQGETFDMWFELIGNKNRKALTKRITINGDAWKEYRLDINPRTVPALGAMEAPYGIKMWWMESKKGIKGDILLDNLTIVGAVDRTKRLSIRRVYEGISYDPSQPVSPKYTIRNTLDTAQTLPLKVVVYNSLDDESTTPIISKTLDVNVPAYGTQQVTVSLGSLPQGHYRAHMSIDGDGVSVRHTDLLAVTTMNNGRINKTPMWFGSQHQGRWTAAIENDFIFDEAVVAMGMDCYRAGGPSQRIVSRGMLAASGFGGMPEHLRRPEDKKDPRGAPNDYDKYYEWVKEEARKRYLPNKDAIIAVEFYNEPDLPRFCYNPEFPEYKKMHAIFAKAFREVIPGVKIATGGNTVEHGHEKKGFNIGTYKDIAGSGQADVANWHAHGSLSNFISRHKMVANWMKQGGRKDLKWTMGNSEAASGSARTPRSWLKQATNVVQKMGWAKAQPESLFYTWFMTTDLMDPQWQGGGEDWGLITLDKRLKASGHAFNEIVRQLANTHARGEVDLGSQVMTCHYERLSGEPVWLIWPSSPNATFVHTIAANGPVTISNIFGGGVKTIHPVNGKVSLTITPSPIYINAKQGITLEKVTGSDYLAFQKSIGAAAGEETILPATVKNIWDKDVTLSVTLENAAGDVVSTQSIAVAKGASVDAKLAIPMAADAKMGTHGHVIRVSSVEAGFENDVLPLLVVVAKTVPRLKTPFAVDGAIDALSTAGTIVLDKKSDTKDLVYDPSTPYWKDANDLSVKLSMAHNTKDLYLCFEVKDQSHNPGKASAKLWAKDSIQLALALDNKHFEFGLTETSGGFGWTWITPDVTKKGRLTAPIKATRKGNVTTYELVLPFEFLGVDYRPGMAARMTFLVNEDDGRNRVRIMKWYDGIASGKVIEKFGYIIIE